MNPELKQLEKIADAHLSALKHKFEDIIIIGVKKDAVLIRYTDMEDELFQQILNVAKKSFRA